MFGNAFERAEDEAAAVYDCRRRLSNITDSLQDFYRYYEDTYLPELRDRYLRTVKLREDEKKYKVTLEKSRKTLARFIRQGRDRTDPKISDIINRIEKKKLEIDSELQKIESFKAEFLESERKYGTLDQVKETIRLKRKEILDEVSEMNYDRMCPTEKDHIKTLEDSIRGFELETRSDESFAIDYLKIPNYDFLKMTLNEIVSEITKEYSLARAAAERKRAERKRAEDAAEMKRIEAEVEAAAAAERKRAKDAAAAAAERKRAKDAAAAAAERKRAEAAAEMKRVEDAVAAERKKVEDAAAAERKRTEAVAERIRAVDECRRRFSNFTDSLQDFYRYYEDTYLPELRDRYLRAEDLSIEEKKYKVELEKAQMRLVYLIKQGRDRTDPILVTLVRKEIKKYQEDLEEIKTRKVEFRNFEAKYGTLDRMKDSMQEKVDGIMDKVNEMGPNKSQVKIFRDNVHLLQLKYVREREDDSDYLKITGYDSLKMTLDRMVSEIENECYSALERKENKVKDPGEYLAQMKELLESLRVFDVDYEKYLQHFRNYDTYLRRMERAQTRKEEIIGERSKRPPDSLLLQEEMQKIEAEINEMKTSSVYMVSDLEPIADQFNEHMRLERYGIMDKVFKMSLNKLQLEIFLDTISRLELSRDDVDYLRIPDYHFLKETLNGIVSEITRGYSISYEKDEKKAETKVEPPITVFSSSLASRVDIHTDKGMRPFFDFNDSLRDFYRYYEKIYLPFFRERYLYHEKIPENEKKYQAALASETLYNPELQEKIREMKTSKHEFLKFEEKYGTLDRVKETMRMKRDEILDKVSKMKASNMGIRDLHVKKLSEEIRQLELKCVHDAQDDSDYLKIAQYRLLQISLELTVYDVMRERSLAHASASRSASQGRVSIAHIDKRKLAIELALDLQDLEEYYENEYIRHFGPYAYVEKLHILENNYREQLSKAKKNLIYFNNQRLRDRPYDNFYDHRQKKVDEIENQLSKVKFEWKDSTLSLLLKGIPLGTMRQSMRLKCDEIIDKLYKIGPDGYLMKIFRDKISQFILKIYAEKDLAKVKAGRYCRSLPRVPGGPSIGGLGPFVLEIMEKYGPESVESVLPYY